MNGPPDNIKPTALWLALTTKPRPHRVIPFPRQDADGKAVGQVALWILTQEELMECQAAAEKCTEDMLKRFKIEGSSTSGNAYRDIYKNAAAVEVISRACREPGDPRIPAFPSPPDIKRWMTSDEISVLSASYAQLQFEIGPIVANMSDAEMDAWLARIGAGGTRFPLASLASVQLEALVMHSATHYIPKPATPIAPIGIGLSTPTTSVGAPLDAPTSPSSSDSASSVDEVAAP